MMQLSSTVEMVVVVVSLEDNNTACLVVVAIERVGAPQMAVVVAVAVDMDVAEGVDEVAGACRSQRIVLRGEHL